jgi:hypothetical protein
MVTKMVLVTVVHGGGEGAVPTHAHTSFISHAPHSVSGV